MNIAMWSGPRNLSTAMMYAFAQRRDTEVRDEPFYAAFLAATGADHPLRDAVLASQDQSFEHVARACANPAPSGVPNLYLKLMAHHMIDRASTGFMSDCVNIFLIRHPARVLASYAAKRENPSLEDIGAVRLLELFYHAKSLGQRPVVIDSADIRSDPPAVLAALCEVIDVPYDPAMLHWAPGGHPQDGIWASHWYGAVHRSSGFAGPEGPLPDLPDGMQSVYKAACEPYEELASVRLHCAKNILAEG